MRAQTAVRTHQCSPEALGILQDQCRLFRNERIFEDIKNTLDRALTFYL